MDIKDKIRNIVKTKNGSLKIYKSDDPEMIKLFNYIINNTRFLEKYYPCTKYNSYTNPLTISIRIAYLLSDMSDIKRCDICGKPVVKFRIRANDNIKTSKNMRYCCAKCAAKDPNTQKLKELTCLKNNGCRHPAQNKNIHNKMENSCIKKYGVRNPSQSELFKQKKRDTIIRHYGQKSYFESTVFKTINKNRYGVEFISQAKEIREKINKTKHKNHTFKISKKENDVYNMLIKKFGKENLSRQYNKDKRYPFYCDFYVKNLDLFIEYNGHWTHGGSPFINSEENKNIIKLWNKKSQNSDYYKIAIDVWTKRDVLKRNTAKQNNLNFIEFWNIKEVEEWIKNCK